MCGETLSDVATLERRNGPRRLCDDDDDDDDVHLSCFSCRPAVVSGKDDHRRQPTDVQKNINANASSKVELTNHRTNSHTHIDLE